MLSVAALLATLAIPTVPVNMHYGQCPATADAGGCYYSETNDLWLTDPTDRVTYWHEMGHAYAAQRMDEGERRAFACLPAMGPPVWGDRNPCGKPWMSGANESFADAYANCQMHRVPSRRTFIYGHEYLPTTDGRHFNACRFIVRAS